MYGVVCAVHQKIREGGERTREEERARESLRVTWYFFFCKHLQFFAGDARMQEAVVSNFYNKAPAANE